MKSSIRHGGGLVKCDAPRCSAKFLSYSVASAVREQASRVGWARVPGWQLELESDVNIKKDVCPKHAAEAAEVKKRRPEILAAEKKARADERAELRAAKKEVKKAERAQKTSASNSVRDSRRADKVAARAVAKAKKKADRLERKVRGGRVHVASAPEAIEGNA